MRLIDEHAAEDYLRSSGRIAAGEPVRVRELTGGVSNMVLLVERPEAPAETGKEFVLKQARAQLRTAHAWYSSLERVWREAEVLTICSRLLDKHPEPAGAGARRRAQTPRILFEDRENYLVAMTAAPRPNTTWKHELLADRVDGEIARACGRLLATLHGESWLDPQIRDALSDCTLFDQLRIDPYYRTLAATCPEIWPALHALIDSLSAHRRSLVHGDFSPKNLLVFAGGLMMVDFETGHYGDPAFDLGFFWSHLVLKACHKIPRQDAYLEVSEMFWATYREIMAAKIAPPELADLEARGVRNFAACAWARLDAKSPVEYLTDPAGRGQMRAVCRQVFAKLPSRWSEVVALCRQRFSQPAAAAS